MRRWSQTDGGYKDGYKDDNHCRDKLICLVSLCESSSVNDPVKLMPEGLQLLHKKQKVLVVYYCFFSWNFKRCYIAWSVLILTVTESPSAATTLMSAGLSL